MLSTIAPAALVPLVLVIALTGIRMHRMLSDDATRYAQQVAVVQAGEIREKLREKTISLKAFAQALSEYHRIPAPVRRLVISEMLKAVFRNQSEVKAAWTLWEPGAIEDDPRPYRGTPLSSREGSFTAAWYRTERGTLQGRLAEESYSQEFYLEPKQQMTPVLVKPHRMAYAEPPADETTVFSISVPIVFGGAFYGAVGIDIELSVYQRVVEPISIYGTGYAVMTTSDGFRISHPRTDLIGTRAGDDLDTARREELLRLIADGNAFSFSKKARATSEDSLVFGVPIRAGTAMPHWMLLLVVPRKEITRQADYALNLLILFGLAAAAILVAAILWAARRLSNPLIALTNEIEGMADGTKLSTISIQGTDELASLASSFNRMSERLGKTLEDYETANRLLESLNSELETKVEERTAALERTLDNLRTTQDHMMKEEKFALLGRLSATIAHELNTPLGAVRSSADYILDNKKTSWPQLAAFARAASETEWNAFERLLQRGIANAANLNIESDRAKRKRFTATLESAGYLGIDGIAADAETLGALDDPSDMLALLGAGKKDAIALAGQISASARAGAIVKLAADKAAKTVAALVGYSRTDEFEITQTVDVVAEIESILVLYYGHIKKTVKIVRGYGCLDPVVGYRDKLNQVWVNLINNALQAMRNVGTLEIRTERDGDVLAVSITDSGPGIPEHLKAKIFTPFFTTKPPGEGTGIGLDICRKIVERHGGTISFTSDAEHTAFTVRLPVRT